jgi:antitoxin (DNA-binding transcriptional repressor) of toxin-antitoxin stability system
MKWLAGCRPGPTTAWQQGVNMATVNLDVAKAHFPEIISGLNPGEQVVIVNNGESMAILTRTRPKQWPCAAGSVKNSRHSMAPDFDALL